MRCVGGEMCLQETGYFPLLFLVTGALVAFSANRSEWFGVARNSVLSFFFFLVFFFVLPHPFGGAVYCTSLNRFEILQRSVLP